MIKLAELSQPLINLIHENLLSQKILHCDETTVQVLNEKDRRPEQKSYMWAMASRNEQPATLFQYYNNRSQKAASDLLQGFEGTLICDGYKVYDSLSSTLSFKLAGCLAHCRRMFFQAKKKKKVPGKINDL